MKNRPSSTSRNGRNNVLDDEIAENRRRPEPGCNAHRNARDDEKKERIGEQRLQNDYPRLWFRNGVSTGSTERCPGRSTVSRRSIAVRGRAGLRPPGAQECTTPSMERLRHSRSLTARQSSRWTACQQVMAAPHRFLLARHRSCPRWSGGENVADVAAVVGAEAMGRSARKVLPPTLNRHGRARAASTRRWVALYTLAGSRRDICSSGSQSARARRGEIQKSGSSAEFVGKLRLG
jgi:hypothetical protein